MKVAKVHTTIALALIAMIGTGNASTLPDTITTKMTVEFTSACLFNSGSLRRIEAWAATKNLETLPVKPSRMFLNGSAGIVWNTSTQTKHAVLIANTNGQCSIMARGLDPIGTELAIEHELDKHKISYQTLPSETSTDAVNTMRLIEASTRTRRWQISVISKIRPKHPDKAPIVVMIMQNTTILGHTNHYP